VEDCVTSTSLSEFEPGQAVRIRRKGAIICTGEFQSSDGERIMLRTIGTASMNKLESFELTGLHLECWPDLKGMEGVAFLRIMDEEDDWCENDFFQKFTQQQIETLHLEGDPAMRTCDALLACISLERLIELLPKQDDEDSVEEVLEKIGDVKKLRSLLKGCDKWQCDVAEDLIQERIDALEPKARKPAIEEDPPPPSKKRWWWPF
jgi:hypothetical protein